MSAYDPASNNQPCMSCEEVLQQLALVLEFVSDATIITNGDGRIMLANTQVQKLFGYQQNELLGQPVEILIPPRFRAAHAAQRASYSSNLRSRPMGVGLDLWGQRKDRSEFPADVSLSPLKTADGILIVSAIRDISRYKQAEEELRRSRNQFAIILQGVADGIAVQDRTGRLIYANDGAARIVGFPSGRALTETPLEDVLRRFEILDESGQPLPPTRLSGRKVLQEGQSAEALLRLRAVASGEERWVAVKATPVRDRHGEVQFAVSILHDITEYRRATEAQRRYAKRLEHLREVDKAIRTTQPPEVTAQAALSRICELVPCRWGSIEMCCPESSECTILATCANGKAMAGGGVRYPLERNSFVNLLQQDQVHVVEEVVPGTPLPASLQILQPEELRSYLQVPLFFRGKRIGSLALSTDRPGAYSDEDVEIAGEVAAQLAVAIQNDRLFEQVREGRERLQTLSRRLIEVQEDERRRISRELHDEIGQALTAVKINLQALQRMHDVPRLAEPLEDSITILQRAVQQVRDLSLDLRPMLLDDLGLVRALRWYVDRTAQRTGLLAQFGADPIETRLPAELETACFRVAQEALTNVVRHAGAHHVAVELRWRAGSLLLTIQDDGVGFDVRAAQKRVAHGAGLGLLGMRERVELLGGQFAIESEPMGGTVIRATFPPGSLALHQPRGETS